MSNTITQTFVKLMLDEYKRYEYIKNLSEHCLTLNQRKILVKHSLQSFRELAVIYLTDYLEITNGECRLEEVIYDYTESDTNADIYKDATIYASDYEEMLPLFYIRDTFCQQKDHDEEWSILATYIRVGEDDDGCEFLSKSVRRHLGEEVISLLEQIFVKHLELELLKEEVK